MEGRMVAGGASGACLPSTLVYHIRSNFRILYSTKRWQWKTLANPTEDCFGEKNIGECIPHK